MRLLISCLLVSASFAFPQHSHFTVQGHGSNSARIKAHLERSNVQPNVPLSTKSTTTRPQKTEILESTTQSTLTPKLTTKRPISSQKTATQRQIVKVIPSNIQPISVPIKRVQPQITRYFKRKAQPFSSSRRTQITGVLQPEENSITKTLFSSIMIDILPEIREFTERIDNSDGTSPEDFVSAVSDLTHSFVKARANDEGREITDEEENTIKLTEIAFNITLGLVKEMNEGDDITSTMKKLTDIVPSLANIVANVEGRELTKYEIEDLKNANEMISSLAPFFGQIGNYNLKSGGFGSGDLSNVNADFVQDYATQNLRNIQDFTNSNSQNFRDYNNLQTKQFSSTREQEYFRNNVRRVQEFARNNRKNVESLPARLSSDGGSLSGLSSQVDDIIKDTLGPVAARLRSKGGRFE